MVIAMTLLAIGLVAILETIRLWLTFTGRIRQDIVSVNLAREGMEQMFNIRNTNRLRRSWKRDECWLKQNPLIDQNGVWCEDDPRIGSGNYVILSVISWSQQSQIITGGNFPDLDIVDIIDTGDKQSGMCYASGVRYNCPWMVEATPEWLFFRQIEVKWLYRKDTTTTWGEAMSCDNGNDTSGGIPCGWSHAKEVRFCSLVAHTKEGFGQSRLCSVITNFEE